TRRCFRPSHFEFYFYVPIIPTKDLLTGFLCCFGRGKTRCPGLGKNPAFDPVQHVNRRFVGSAAAHSERSTEQANEENKASSPQNIDHDRFLEKTVVPGNPACFFIEGSVPWEAPPAG